ncbi:hypothetical protein LAZ67_7002336 [Cordylochernes scorpioides]|uniref:Uncharacterized protein n=1 Tax=Cordylochernes scorpioides TaxID=51811 RepID=A0ABY6KP19_9ARAC|nr:hypothetical protein LAZ67_7002336 [Cordylochernes scorpioides]
MKHVEKADVVRISRVADCLVQHGQGSNVECSYSPMVPVGVRSEDPSVYAVKGRGLAFLIDNLYYEDIAVNIPNTLDLETQGIKVYLNQNKAINIYNMYHPPNNTFIDDGTMAQFLTDNTIILEISIKTKTSSIKKNYGTSKRLI